MIINNFLKKWFYDIDKFTLLFAFALMFFGIIMSFTTSPAITNRISISNQYHFTYRQLVFCLIGSFVIVFCSMLSHNFILNISFIGYIFCLLLLFFVLIIGSSIKGSNRWLNFGFFVIQPSEIMKPFFVIINAYLLSISLRNNIIPIFLLLNFGLLILLFILQPDFGSALLYIMIFVIQLFLCNIKIKTFLYLFTPILLFIFFIGFSFFPHIHYRVINFFTMRGGKEQYQTKKAIESIYHGGLFGQGAGEGVVKYQLPDAHTDYIFSVICEEFGIIFVSFLILSFIIFMYRHLASNIFNKKYEIRVIYGLVFIFILQSCIHIAVNTNMMPSKGMTLPFISYGGSSVISNSIIFGFLLAFTRKSYTYNSPYKYI